MTGQETITQAHHRQAHHRRHHLQAHCLELCNSGQTTRDLQRVVGYGAFALLPEASHD